MSLLTLFELLSQDSRCIVYSDEPSGIIVTWNHSLTLQAWRTRNARFYEFNAQTLEEKPSNWLDAHKAALRWMQGDAKKGFLISR